MRRPRQWRPLIEEHLSPLATRLGGSQCKSHSAPEDREAPISVTVAAFEEYALGGNARFEHIVTIVTDIH